MKLLSIYLVIVNALSFLLMLIDKRRAKKKFWRIPESTLLLFPLLGGGLGATAGMFCFHHKTKHMKFLLGLPAILLLNILSVYFLVRNL